MSRILFTVCGVGLGHASRSLPVIKGLMKKNDVLVVSYGQGYEFLRKEFGGSESINWFELKFSGDKYLKTRTILNGIPRLPVILAKNFYKLIRIVRSFKPDLIVSDFDVNGLYVGELFGIPVVVLSSMHLANYVDLKLDFNTKLNYYLTEKPILTAFGGADYLFISSFVKPRSLPGNVFFFWPLAREGILSRGVSENGFFLVYSSNDAWKEFGSLFTEFDSVQFKIYGTSRSGKKSNLEFKKFSNKNFFDDFRNCNGLFSHGGMSAISEAVLLKKPVFVRASPNFFERYFNGLLVERSCFGVLHEKATRQNLSDFFERIPEFKRSLEKADIQPGNAEIIAKIKELLQKGR